MNLMEAAKLVEERALAMSIQRLNGNSFESFDGSLLRIEDSDINDHIDCQSSGQLYYGMLVRKALESLQKSKLLYEDWFSKVYDRCNEIIRAETGIKRPNKVDVEYRVRKDYKLKTERYTKMINKAEYVYERLNLWYSAWITKGFSLSDMKANKMFKGSRDVRSLISKKGKHNVEE